MLEYAFDVGPLYACCIYCGHASDRHHAISLENGGAFDDGVPRYELSCDGCSELRGYPGWHSLPCLSLRTL